MHHYEYQSEFARKYVEEGRKDGLEEGRKDGLEEGRKEGLKEGLKEGRQEVLGKLLSLKFGELPDWAAQRLRAADDTDLARWTERVLTAPTLDDVFAG
jgi:predicted transposase YdaD